MNGGEVVVCSSENGCGKPFEVLREELPTVEESRTCPYCGAPCGPGIGE